MNKQSRTVRQNKDFSNSQRNQLSRLKLLKLRENICLQYLLKLMNNKTFLPNTSMNMSPVTILHIVNEIIINQRTSIIEFGTGNSTIYIAALLKEFGIRAKFYSIENDDIWIEKTRKYMIDNELDQFVEFIHAPIVKTSEFQNQLVTNFNWYKTKEIKSIIGKTKFDLIIVDGPKGTMGPYSRFPAIPFLEDHLSSSFTLFLDDTDREEEEDILKSWSTLLCERISYKDLKYGCISRGESYMSFPS